MKERPARRPFGNTVLICEYPIDDTAAGLVEEEKMKTENDIKQALAENIRAYLKREGVTQKDLAEMCGVSENSIGFYVRGKSVPSLYYAYLLSDVMGITIDEMMMPIKSREMTPEEKAERG